MVITTNVWTMVATIYRNVSGNLWQAIVTTTHLPTTWKRSALSLRNGFTLLCIDNGDYYYYQMVSGYWWKDSADTTPAQPATPAEPKPEQPTTSLSQHNQVNLKPCPTPQQNQRLPTPAPSDKPEEPTTIQLSHKSSNQVLTLPETHQLMVLIWIWSIQTIYRNANGTKTRNTSNPAIQTTLVWSTEEPSETKSLIMLKTSWSWLEHSVWAPNGQTPKLVYPPGKNQVMQSLIKTTTSDGSAHYYYVPSNSERTGYSAYWKWLGGMETSVTPPKRSSSWSKTSRKYCWWRVICTATRTQAWNFTQLTLVTTASRSSIAIQDKLRVQNYVIEKWILSSLITWLGC